MAIRIRLFGLLLFPALMVACNFGGIPDGSNMPQTFTPEERRSAFHAGPVWDGSAPDQSSEYVYFTREEFTELPGLPAFWLGEQYEGYNFQPPYGVVDGAAPRIYAPYGVYCTLGSDGTCLGPQGHALSVITQSVCASRPESIIPSRRQGKQETMRGGAIVIQTRTGDVYIWTGYSRILIYMLVDVSKGKDAIQALRGIGPVSGHIGPDDPLPPPDFSRC